MPSVTFDHWNSLNWSRKLDFILSTRVFGLETNIHVKLPILLSNRVFMESFPELEEINNTARDKVNIGIINSINKIEELKDNQNTNKDWQTLLTNSEIGDTKNTIIVIQAAYSNAKAVIEKLPLDLQGQAVNYFGRITKWISSLANNLNDWYSILFSNVANLLKKIWNVIQQVKESEVNWFKSLS